MVVIVEEEVGTTAIPVSVICGSSMEQHRNLLTILTQLRHPSQHTIRIIKAQHLPKAHTKTPQALNLETSSNTLPPVQSKVTQVTLLPAIVMQGINNLHHMAISRLMVLRELPRLLHRLHLPNAITMLRTMHGEVEQLQKEDITQKSHHMVMVHHHVVPLERGSVLLNRMIRNRYPTPRPLIVIQTKDLTLPVPTPTRDRRKIIPIILDTPLPLQNHLK